MTSAPAAVGEARKAVAAAVVGNVLEWYDFAVYSFLAGVIGRNFFPSADPSAEVLYAFAVFGMGFLARPLGAVIIGRIGDTRGRKTALLLTIFLMAAGDLRRRGHLRARRHPGGTPHPGLFRRRRVGRLHGVHRGVGARRQARLLRQLPAVQCGRRAPAGVGPRRPHEHGPHARVHGGLGLARALPAGRAAGPRGPLAAAHHRRDARLPGSPDRCPPSRHGTPR
jgi:hypothetical protein